MKEFLKIKEGLEKRLQTLAGRVDHIEKDLREPHDDDWSENASESEGDEVLEEVGKMADKEINQIRLALARIEKGTYGICGGCGDKIAQGRLEALPHATRCIKCASEN